MKQIAIIRSHNILPDSPIRDASRYPYREAARAVLFDGARVALLYVGRDKSYKLPGGGIEPGETKLQALRREVLEETGYHIENIQELGETLEHKDHKPELQRSFCFIAHTTGISVPFYLTQEEKAAGIRTTWADNLTHAIDLLEKTQPTRLGAQFIRYRELLFLRAAQELL